jgi:exopolyphosphatase/guanosine-5'-triphosphate,3'-diphosphate pyrophosphatase
VGTLTMTAAQRSNLPGISRARAKQSLAGAITATELMSAFAIEQVDVCPWSLREGLMLHRFDSAPSEPRQLAAVG